MLIKAYDSEGRNTGYLNARLKTKGQVRIRDIGVGEAHKGLGIGTKRLKTLESQLPNGTELYFQENHAEEFWKKKRI